MKKQIYKFTKKQKMQAGLFDQSPKRKWKSMHSEKCQLAFFHPKMKIFVEKFGDDRIKSYLCTILYLYLKIELR